jgi:hypothetical protein
MPCTMTETCSTTGGDVSRGLDWLAVMLATETRDAEQIERIMRTSKMFQLAEKARKKWDAKRGQGTWGTELITSAMQRERE